MLVVILSSYPGIEQWILQTRCLLNAGLSVIYSEVWNVVFFFLLPTINRSALGLQLGSVGMRILTCLLGSSEFPCNHCVPVI